MYAPWPQAPLTNPTNHKPDSRRLSLALLADQLVEVEVVESISPETARQAQMMLTSHATATEENTAKSNVILETISKSLVGAGAAAGVPSWNEHSEELSGPGH